MGNILKTFLNCFFWYCPEIIIELDDEVEPEPEEELLSKSDPEEDPEWEHGDDFGLEIENDHTHEPEPHVEMDIESGPEAEDTSEDEAPPKKIHKTQRD